MEKMQNITFITIPFCKFYLNQTSITIKKMNNLIQEKTIKFSCVSKFIATIYCNKIIEIKCRNEIC